MTTPLDLANQELVNGLVIEASAGTGKTFSVAALIVREIALAGELDPLTGLTRPDLSIAEILVTTFTRNAAAELRDRVRRRLVETAQALRAEEESDDVVTAALAVGSKIEVDRRVERLARAIAEYDSATISTIHSICLKVLTLAGESAEMGEEDEEGRIIDEVVNDVLVAGRDTGQVLDSALLKKAVRSVISEPDTVRWCDPIVAMEESSIEARAALARAVDLVSARLESSPCFSYLVTRAHKILVEEGRQSVISEFQRRYRFVIVDEAQDTDGQQWRIFRTIFPLGDVDHGGSVIAVGDPKQSIYRFRGADVDAYTEERDKGTTVSLVTNFRSDARVIAGLNDFFSGVTFGGGIPYVPVVAAPSNAKPRTSLANAVEVIEMDGVTEQHGLAEHSARRVADILNDSRAMIDFENPDGTWSTRRIQPSDVVVLVRSGGAGEAIQRALRRLKIPAVTSGTSSVMLSESAEHWRVLLLSLERLANQGRVRHVLGSPLFGVPLTSPALFDDGFLSWAQGCLFTWLNILRSSGVAALAAAILADSSIVLAMSGGDVGERRLTDFSHVADLLHDETNGVGCTPSEALEAFGSLVGVDEKSELVSRRVESDSRAVEIMTIHKSKGLEFPVVVVADLWVPKDPFAGDDLPFFHAVAEDGLGHTGRTADVGWLTDKASPFTGARLHQEFLNESSRLLYVAMTRSKHHVSIMKSNSNGTDLLDMFIDEEVLKGNRPSVAVRSISKLLPPREWTPPKTHAVQDVSTSPMNRAIERNYVRTSFSGILEVHHGRTGRHGQERPSGTDEGSGISGRFARPAGTSVPDALDGLGNPVTLMPMARIPGGTNIGTILHHIYEQIDPAHPDLRIHVERVVDRHLSGRLALAHRAHVVDGVLASLQTPFGGAFGDITLASLGSAGRAAELKFEMSMTELSRDGIKVSDVGRILLESLGNDDVLFPYAGKLTDPSFDIGLGGLINGSIDALLQVHDPEGKPVLVVSDYKSNRLDKEGDSTLMDGYTRDRMLAEMERHHYPLQAIIYGAAVYRFLRARRSAEVAESSVAGFAYLFVRGMVGPETPVVDGHRSGVFTWTAPAGFWPRMSDFFAGARP